MVPLTIKNLKVKKTKMMTQKSGLMKRSKLINPGTPSTKEAMYHLAVAEQVINRQKASRKAHAMAARAASSGLVDDAPAPTVVYVQAPGPKPEKKSVDFGLAINAFSATLSDNSTLRLVNGIQTGSGYWNRVGRKVINKSIRIKLNGGWTYDMTATLIPTNVARIIVIWDADPSHGGIPPFNQIFANTDQTGTVTASLTSALKVTESERYRILRDTLIPFSSQTGSTSTSAAPVTVIQSWTYDEFIPLKDAETDYYANSNPMTNADMEKGSIYVVMAAEENVTTAGTRNFIDVEDGFARIRYSDP